ncbi:hypothetical protein H0H87_001593 [Tephrocybe sp. NHM501043]|nr:hypothetical protein H0H87_001593 [Tephrocybe sp. NHM501043]
MFALIATGSSKAPASALRRCASSIIPGSGPNEKLLKQLRDDLKKEQLEKATRALSRQKALLSAMEVIKGLNYELTHVDMVANANKIVQELTTIDGLTKLRAERLIALGVKNRDDLLKPEFYNTLPPALQMNVRHASHLERPVTRQQTEIVAVRISIHAGFSESQINISPTIQEFLRDHLTKKYEIIPVGSYRRGATESSCVRLLISHPDYLYLPPPPPPPPGALQPYRLEALKAPGFLKEFPLHRDVTPQLEDFGLSVSSRVNTYQSWNGVFRVPEKDGKRWESSFARRKAAKVGLGDYVLTRLFMLPYKSRGAALLYHTGSKSFIRIVTHKAEKLGLYFSQTGLWKWHPDEAELELGDGGKQKKNFPKRVAEIVKEKESEGGEGRAKGFWQLLPSTTEEEIFDQLQIDYVELEKRGALNL